jgi:nitrogen fixation/metabolism regulation signal transduction histidine kinase
LSGRPSRWNYEARLFVGATLVALPALLGFAIVVVLAYGLRWQGITALLIVSMLTLAFAVTLQRRAVFPLYTLSNLLEALREGDYSLRGSRARRGDAIGEVVWEINTLAQTLREQRLVAEEKSALLTKVIAALDIAVLAFDAQHCLKLANPAAERLLGRSFAQAAGCSADELGMADCLEHADAQLVERSFAGASGRWEIRRTRFREEGRPHDLVVISDLSRALREEERLAWQRLLRVLGHELNNSLAPIRSMASTVSKLIASEPPPSDWRDDASSGLGIIADRAEALARFMSRYTALARLPPPSRRGVAFETIAMRAARLEQRLEVRIDDSPAVLAELDPDQIEQALINLIQNATDAASTTGGGVGLRWRTDGGVLIVEILDDGPGLPPSENLFVPFFTTKPGGSGIGLVLARQIVEQHGGSLTLANRDDARGCIAQMRLPLP